MKASLETYIDLARRKGRTDEQIIKNLVEAGWDENTAQAAVAEDDSLLPPPPPPGQPEMASNRHAAHAIASHSAFESGRPGIVKVVSYRSTAGLEYLITFISLWVAAMSLASVLHSLIDTLIGNGDSFYEGIATFASSALLVSLPIFTFMFLRLKKRELGEPAIRTDPSRKAAVQLTLIITFVIALGRTAFWIYQLMNVGNMPLVGNASYLSETLHALITVGISGLIFGYYWVDDHRKIESEA